MRRPTLVTITRGTRGADSPRTGTRHARPHRPEPAVAGTWEYRAREYDAEVPNGGAEDSGVITVR